MTETEKRRSAIVVANEKGGVGKSTLALAITDKLTIAGHSPVVIQIDRQKRLSAALGADIIIKSEGCAYRSRQGAGAVQPSAGRHHSVGRGSPDCHRYWRWRGWPFFRMGGSG